ncbi:mucin-2-like isoform X1 [Oenanthe melanoleuca]|uniref:mucin-2-like isoform X1 n=1 Tax=Oenanthe melanoleuca TaxID=2939378 RepID=UPI0024C153F4|nr:mucin-2-like isoform X1 [Oenanthe melanoleuca]
MPALDMARGTGGLPLLLLSLAVLDLPLETIALLPNTSSSTAATFPSSRPATSTPKMPMDAFTANASTAQQSSLAASNITMPQAKGSTAHSTPVSPRLGPTTSTTPAQLGPTTSTTPAGLGLTTTNTPTPTSMAMTSDCDKTPTFTSVGTSTTLAASSFGVEMSMLPPPTSSLLSSTGVGTTLGTSTHQGPAMTTLLGSTSLGTSTTSASITREVTDTSDGPWMVLSDTMASLATTTDLPGSIPVPSQPAGTTPGTIPGTSTPTEPETPSDTAETTAMGVTATVSPPLPTSSTPVESSTLLPATDSTTTATFLSSSPDTEASTPEESSTSEETGNTSPASVPPPTTATEDSVESLTTLADTTASLAISTSDPMSISSSADPDETTPDIFPSTMESTPGTELSSPATSSAQTSEATTLSTPTDLAVLPTACPSGSSNTSASQLFLSLRLTTPLDLGNTTVQEQVLTKLRENLQTEFPCAGLSLAWRGKRRT